MTSKITFSKEIANTIGLEEAVLLEHLKAHQGQSFITAAHPVAFSDFVDFDDPDHMCITIKDGNVAETK